MAGSTGDPRSAVSKKAVQQGIGRFCWLELVLWLVWLACMPALVAAQDDVSPSIRLPQLPRFEVIKIPSVPVTVPDVRKQPWEKAVAILDGEGLTTQEFPLFRDSTEPDNTVIGQDPAPGAKVKRGTSVTLTVSRQTLVTVPNVRERPWEKAQAILRRDGLVPSKVPRYRESSAPDNTVIDQEPRSGARVKPGTTVQLILSRQRLIMVPDVRKRPLDEAKRILRRDGLVPSVSPRYRESSAPDNTVIEQDPRPGDRVKPGTTLQLTLSRQQLVTVPDVRGPSWREAKAILDKQGLRTQEFPLFRDAIEPDNTVIDQDPLPGARVKRGSSVTLTVARQAMPDLTLKVFGPDQVRQGEPVRYTARLSRQIAGANVTYRFYVGTAPITGWIREPSIEHAFDEAGTTSVIAEARVVLNEQSRTPRAAVPQVRVVPPPPPEVTISPRTRRVEQGDPASISFTARVQAEIPVDLVWDGPAGERTGTRAYEIDTRRVSPGTYQITVTAYAEWVDPVTARSTLVVEEPYRPPRAGIENLTPRVAIGDPVELRGRYAVDPRRSPDVRWEGALGTREQVETLTTDSERLGLGRHTFEFVVSDGRETVRAGTTVEVYTPLEPPLARIDPPEAEVIQGDTVTFHDVSPRDNRGELSTTWVLPDGNRRGGRRLDLDTSDWAVRMHEIVLQLDGPFRRSDTATAGLRVTPAYRPPRAAIEPPGGYRVEQGEPAVFVDASATDGRFPVTRRWAGSAGVHGGAERLRIDTAVLDPGEYEVALTVEDARGEDSARVPLTVLAPPPPPELRIEPPRASVIRGDRVNFGFTVTPPDAVVGDPAWVGPQGRSSAGRAFVLATRDLPPGRHDIELTAHDERQRLLSAVAALEVRDPGVALRVDRSELPPGESAVFTPQITPELPGAVLWLRIDGAEGLRRVEATAPLSHLFSEVGVYKAMLIVERDGLRWESAPVQVVVEALIWQRVRHWLPWLGGLAGLVALVAGGTLAWRRLHPHTPRPGRGGVRFETALRVDPDSTRSAFGPQSAEWPGLAVAVVTDRGIQVVTETEEQDGEPAKPSGA